MIDTGTAFSGFAVDDIARARQFYAEVLGMSVTEEHGMLFLDIARGARVLVYPRPGHVPAPFTVLNFPVPDVAAAVEELVAGGVTFERYDGMPQDERGIMTGGGPLIAWFTDPAGNVLSVIEQ